jgi:NAD(P)-dependent dehydrogenase (short-subunit alcohol dehydrogenase family)
MGARVIITTRFPHDAAGRYAKEPDFDAFADRLFIYGLDFRDMSMVHGFCQDIIKRFERLDVLINNAAQTVRKPPKFYEHLISGESVSVPRAIGEMTHVVDVFKGDDGYNFIEKSRLAQVDGNNTKDITDQVALPASSALASLNDVNTSASLSQIHLLSSDASDNRDELFPKGILDRDDQQLDLRTENSWLLELGQVSTVEMLECHVINVFAPWVLVSDLKPLMERTTKKPTQTTNETPDALCDKYIVNVSAMEGQFYRPKSIFHPHSNMAKAALNMMTRTSAAGFAEICIYMTAVDTGWITDENPVDQWYKRENAPPPLDEWDAAMRVLDPVIDGMNGKEPVWGVFLKNYFPTRW